MLEIGDTIHLHISNQNSASKYRAKVVNMSTSSYFISLPVNEKTNRTSVLENGVSCEAQFVTREKSMYSFQTQVVGREKKEIPMILLKRPEVEQFNRIQRRAYVRVNFQTDIAIHPCKRQFPPFTTVTVDISGGGIGILLKDHHKLKEHDIVECSFNLPMQSGDVVPIQQKCKVIRIKQIDMIRKASLQIEKINDGEREKIVRFCFERQLELRRKGLE